MAAFREESKEVAIDAELIGGPADGMRVRVASNTHLVEIPVATSQEYKCRTVTYSRSVDPRKFKYVPNKSK